jgi:hypothetical protein
MKKQRPVTAMRRRAKAPAILPAIEPPPATNPVATAADNGPQRLDTNTNRNDSDKFRAEILRRYDAPYSPPWQHGGLNE